MNVRTKADTNVALLEQLGQCGDALGDRDILNVQRAWHNHRGIETHTRKTPKRATVVTAFSAAASVESLQ